ncbi:MAG: efflux RND transporter periplasmic adaptor subunit, partial [bacterium]
ILLSSNLETEKMTDVYSRVQGLVDKIFVEEGDYVKKNQVLMKLEADEYSLAEAKARVEYEQQNSLYERSEAMYKKQLLSKEEFEQARFGIEAKKIQWQQAKLNLDYTNITSPISGVIGERLKRQGDRIQPSDKLFTVINTEEMIAVVHIPEKEISNIAKGQRAFVTSDHLPGKEFSGWIKRVSPVVDPQSGTFKVTIGLRNVENRLRPGMFVNIHIITDTHKNAVLIPKTAIVYENENMHVFVVRDSLAHKITLKAGYQDYEKVESLSGIEEGEKIIVVGQAGLKDKTKVNIVAERESS